MAKNQTIKNDGRKSNWQQSLSWTLWMLIVCFISSSGWAAEGTWKALGPEGGNYAGVVIHPTDALQVTAITSGPSCAYNSQDGGLTWEETSLISSDSLYDFCAFDYTILYALTYGTLYSSVNGGLNWTRSQFSYEIGTPLQVACHPTDPQILYAAGYYYNYLAGNSVYQLIFFTSTDGGRRWKNTKHFACDFIYPYSLSISASNPAVMYISAYKQEGQTSGYVLLRSTDAGAHWTDITAKIKTNDNESYTDVVIDPDDENHVLVSGEYIKSSADGGETWTSTPQQTYTNSLFFDPTDHQKIYAGSYNMLYISSDRGENWNYIIHESYPIIGQGNSIAVSLSNPSTLYLGTSSALYRSTDGGNIWKPSQKGIKNSTTSAMALSPSDPQTLYIKQENQGEFRTQDGGDSWDELQQSYMSGNTIALLVHPTDPQRILALESYGYPTCEIYQSVNAGKNWNSVDQFFRRGQCLAQDNRDPNVMYAGGVAAVSEEYKIAISKSSDGGSTWDTHFLLPTTQTTSYYSIACNWITLSRENSMVIYVAGVDDDKAAVFRTDNGGGVWKNITNNLLTLSQNLANYSEAYTILCHPKNEYTLLLGTSDNVYISTNGGNSWRATNLNRSTTALVYDFANDLIYAATDNGVYFSEDGTRWKLHSSALSRIQCNALCINPLDGTLYVGTYGHGVWRYSTQVGIPHWGLY